MMFNWTDLPSSNV